MINIFHSTKIKYTSSEKLQPIFNLSVAFLILNLVLFGAIFNLVCTIIVLYYKDKLELEIRFQNKPWILKFIKFYEKTSYASIIYETILILTIVLLMIGLTTFGIINILNLIFILQMLFYFLLLGKKLILAYARYYYVLLLFFVSLINIRIVLI